MDEDGLVSNWQQSKRRSTALRLAEQCLKEQEYKRDQFGHPSSYAFVRFECLPADSLSFEMDTAWPGHLTPEYSSTCYWLVLQTRTEAAPSSASKSGGMTFAAARSRSIGRPEPP